MVDEVLTEPVFRLPPFTVEQVFTARSQSTDWGIRLLNIPPLWKETRGKGIKIAVLDTGISLVHGDLQGAILDAKDFTGSPTGPADDNGHGCLHPDGIVYTSFCGVEKISVLWDRVDGPVFMERDGTQIKILSDTPIWTHSLDYKSGVMVRDRVTHIHRIPVSENVVTICHADGKTTLTPWHPCYIEKRPGGKRTFVKVRADEVKIGDRLVRGLVNPPGVRDDVISVRVSRPQCSRCGNLFKNRRVWKETSQCCKCYGRVWGQQIIDYPIDEETAYILGLVVTDGSFCDNYYVRFSNLNVALLDRFASGVSRFGRGVRKCKDDRSDCWDYRVSGPFLDICKAVGINKTKVDRPLVPEIISKSPVRVILAYLSGLIDGDGTVSKDGGDVRFITGREDEAGKIATLVKILGGTSSVSKSKAHGKFPDGCVVRISLMGLDKWGYKFRGVSNPRKIRNRSTVIVKDIRRSKFDGHFFDFTTEKTHTYWGDGVFISNTACLSIIAARDNDVGIIGVANEGGGLVGKVLNSQGAGGSRSITAGIRWMIEKKADIISMSFGSPSPDASINQAIEEALSVGIVVVCAAGNEGSSLDTVGWPAQLEGVISVGAIDQTKVIARFSSRGKRVDIVAPGVNILVDIPPNNQAVMSGTCLAKGSYVYGPGGPKRIEDIQQGDVVFAYKDGKVVERTVAASFYRGTAEVHQLRAAGRDVFATSSHKMLAIDSKTKEIDWVSVGSLSDRYKLLLPRELPNKINPYLDSILSEDFCFLLGFFAGDGWLTDGCRTRRVCFARGDSDGIIKKVEDIYQRTFGKQMKQNLCGSWSFDDSTKSAMIIESLGLNSYAKDKTIPLWVWTLSVQKQMAFYKGYRTADGHVCKAPGHKVLPDGFECSSKDLVRRLSCFADYRGWKRTTVSSRKRLIKAPNSKERSLREFHSVRIYRNPPLDGWQFLRIQKKSPVNGVEVAKQMGIDTSALFAASCRVDGNKGTVDVYDLSVPDADCFVTQGIITHNSFACPYAAGVIALMLAKHRAQGGATPVDTPQQVIEHLHKTSLDLGPVGWDSSYGFGLISPEKLLSYQPPPGSLDFVPTDFTETGLRKLRNLLGDLGSVTLRVR